MTNVKISDIKPERRFKTPVMLDKMFIVTVPPCPVTRGQISNLLKWGFKEVFVDEEVVIKTEDNIIRPHAEVNLAKTESVDLSEFAENLADKPAKSKESIPEKFKQTESVDISDFEDKPESHQTEVKKSFSSTTKQAQTSLSAYLSTHDPKGAQEALKFSVGQKDESVISEAEDLKSLESAQKTYEKFMDYINYVYTHYATHKVISQPELNGKVLELCNFVRETKKFILRISPSFEARNKNFLISHSMRTTVLAIVIGMQLNMPYEKLIELGVASVLHEIGQIRIPPQLYMNEKPLTPSEKAQMATHTVIGYNIVKQAGFPLTIQLGVLDHHERETGTGYPRHLTGASISTYAKIIAVACSYEAITAPRHYKDAKTTYEGMVEMLKNSNHLYDDTVVKALLYSVSLFPIGAYVYLANGKVGQVVDVSPSSPKNPIVKIIGGINKDGSAKIVQTDDQMLKIVRVMTKEETKDLIAALGDTVK